jgi:hypothetical protein
MPTKLQSISPKPKDAESEISLDSAKFVFETFKHLITLNTATIVLLISGASLFAGTHNVEVLKPILTLLFISLVVFLLSLVTSCLSLTFFSLDFLEKNKIKCKSGIWAGLFISGSSYAVGLLFITLSALVLIGFFNT